MKNEGDLSECGMVAGAKWAGLSESGAVDLLGKCPESSSPPGRNVSARSDDWAHSFDLWHSDSRV